MIRIFVRISMLSACLMLLSCQQAQPPAKVAEIPAVAGTPVDFQSISEHLVTAVGGIKEGDTVWITGCARDLEFLEDLAVSVRETGAFPLLSVAGERMAKQYYARVPEKYDSQPPGFDLKLWEITNAGINVEATEAEDALSGIPPARIAAVAKAQEPVTTLLSKRNVRMVYVGNGLYPTEWRARRFGMSQQELAKTFWEAVNANYSEVHNIAEKLKALLSAGKELHITNSSGTDLRVGIEGRRYFVSDGVISEEDIKSGAPATFVYLPAGEVFCAPVPGTAEGKVVVPLNYYNGKEVADLTMTFSSGKLASISGSGPGYAEFKADYDAAGPGKDLFSFVDFGINPNLHLWPTSKVGNWVQSGMVTVGSGNNIWAGGDITTAYGMTNFLPGSTVTLDGKTIVENGVLK